MKLERPEGMYFFHPLNYRNVEKETGISNPI